MIHDPCGDVFVFPFAGRNHLSGIHRHAGSVSADYYHPGMTKPKTPEAIVIEWNIAKEDFRSDVVCGG